MDKPRFTCGYQGVSDYNWRGKTYCVRYSAADWSPVWNYTPEKYAEQVVALVGCIYCQCGNDQFPPAELEAHFPGYVRARFDRATWTVEYADGKRPEQVHSTVYKSTQSKVRNDEMKSHGWAV